MKKSIIILISVLCTVVFFGFGCSKTNNETDTTTTQEESWTNYY